MTDDNMELTEEGKIVYTDGDTPDFDEDLTFEE